MGEAVLADVAKKRGLSIEVDSAGTAGYHVGEEPDERCVPFSSLLPYLRQTFDHHVSTGQLLYVKRYTLANPSNTPALEIHAFNL